MINQLQQYTYNRKTYFVDYRLNQFRTVAKPFEPIDFVEFQSGLGDLILCKMLKEKVLDLSQYNF